MCDIKAEVNGSKTPLGEMLVSDVVYQYIKQATEESKCDYLQSLVRNQVKHTFAAGRRFNNDLEASVATMGIERRCKGELYHGPTTFFITHCWAYKFKHLVALVMRHYDSQPGTQAGRVYQPIFYWLDIFAVFQNFEGDFKDHPDSDFPSVIRSSQAVLFTIMPWRSPMCVERVWCLYEALQAVLQNVDLDLLVEEVQSSQVRLKR